MTAGNQLAILFTKRDRVESRTTGNKTKPEIKRDLNLEEPHANPTP